MFQLKPPASHNLQLIFWFIPPEKWGQKKMYCITGLSIFEQICYIDTYWHIIPSDVHVNKLWGKA